MESLARGLGSVGVLLAALTLVAAPGAAASPAFVEVVIALDEPSLARAISSSRVLTAAAKRGRLALDSPTSAGHLRLLAASQRILQTRIAQAVPEARVRWRYSVVVNALAVVLPADRVQELASLPGVSRLYPTVRYRSRLNRTPQQIGADQLWSPDLATAGDGITIAILDDGIDQRHPFFSPRNYTMPPGFPKGNRAYTTAKVIVAKAFPPRSPSWRHAAKPFDPTMSEHGTHVAGIAAGNHGVVPEGRRLQVSGVAPRAYLGNYKVLTIPTDSGVGLDGNSPEIARGIEEAVKDGMDILNLSLGEPEIEPTRDLVVEAIQGAVDAGVVVTVAAGNDFPEFGAGSIGSPGTATKAITVGATEAAGGAIASFSSGGPTPLSLQLKPDVSAPGAGVLSSVPSRDGLWDLFSGTSMAAPHVAGAAALLRERHPDWTPAQIKSALVSTGDPVLTESGTEVPTTREGGGRVNVVRANDPLVLSAPASLSFGLVRRGTSTPRVLELTDAGGGSGDWTASIAPQKVVAGVTVSAPPSATVPGSLEVTVTATARAARGESTGFVVLARGDLLRRIPYWFRVSAPALGGHRATPLTRPGIYRGSTARKPALVSSYRYPEDPTGAGVRARLDGPEQVFRVRITRPVANFGVAVLTRAPGVRVEPRIVAAGDEDRQVGYTSLPLNLNPYLASFEERRLVSGAVRPAPGQYDVVFDTPSRATAGGFTFRFWVDDATPPALRLLSRVPRNGWLRVRASDAGSGVDPRSITATVDGELRRTRIARGVASVDVSGLRPGRHRLFLQVSDHQETRNMENVPRILPNTTRLRVAFVVR